MYKYLLTTLTALGAILALFLKAFQWGRDKEKANQNEKKLFDVKQKKDIDNEISKLDDTSIDDRLSKWVRPKGDRRKK